MIENCNRYFSHYVLGVFPVPKTFGSDYDPLRSLVDKPFKAKIQHCPLWSRGGKQIAGLTRNGAAAERDLFPMAFRI
jgi:hypothetical protein